MLYDFSGDCGSLFPALFTAVPNPASGHGTPPAGLNADVHTYPADLNKGPLSVTTYLRIP